MSLITTKDGMQILLQGLRHRAAVMLSHGWPLTADSWEEQMYFQASNAIVASRMIGEDMAARVNPGKATK